MDNIAIIIPCYNRIDTLKNLLRSLQKAHYSSEVDLVFSIDYSGSDLIVNYARSFEWKYGKKEIIHHKKNIGLRRNIISCGDMTDKYDAVIILEDDLLVSPVFFDYACDACDFYGDNDKIAGISLYSYRMSENLHEFNPIACGYDTYFIQWTSSWGQLWTRKQWKSFKEWYTMHCDDISTIPIPDFVRTWTHSWKKFNIAYLVDCDKYYVYPVVSYTSVQPALGIHVAEIKLNKDNIVPLSSGYRRDLVFQPFNKTLLYDCFFEVKTLTFEINGVKICADCNFYGHKTKDNIRQNYFITTQKIPHIDIVKSWGIISVPFETNVIDSHDGEDLFLYRSEDFQRVYLTPSDKVALRIKLTNNEKVSYYLKRTIQLLKK